jgi:hypothetical protein
VHAGGEPCLYDRDPENHPDATMNIGGHLPPDESTVVLSESHVRVYEVDGDGHCLYHALNCITRWYGDGALSVRDLRDIIATHIAAHLEDGQGPHGTFAEFIRVDGSAPDAMQYIHILRRGRAASGAVPHGGHIEMSAFAAEYGVTVEVYETPGE